MPQRMMQPMQPTPYKTDPTASLIQGLTGPMLLMLALKNSREKKAQQMMPLGDALGLPSEPRQVQTPGPMQDIAGGPQMPVATGTPGKGGVMTGVPQTSFPGMPQGMQSFLGAPMRDVGHARGAVGDATFQNILGATGVIPTPEEIEEGTGLHWDPETGQFTMDPGPVKSVPAARAIISQKEAKQRAETERTLADSPSRIKAEIHRKIINREKVTPEEHALVAGDYVSPHMALASKFFLESPQSIRELSKDPKKAAQSLKAYADAIEAIGFRTGQEQFIDPNQIDQMLSFNSVEEARKANLPPGTLIMINGRRAITE